MRQTNYQRFDFLDISPESEGTDRLWKAGQAGTVRCVEGVVFISIPFVLHPVSSATKSDESSASRNMLLRIQSYGDSILRVSLQSDESEPAGSEMLQMDTNLSPTMLQLRQEQDGTGIFDQNGIRRAFLSTAIPAVEWWSDLLPAPDETVQLTFFPDGKHPVVITPYDLFGPSQHEAYPFAFIEKQGRHSHTSCAFACKHDESFYGSGERFGHLDLSGRAIQLYNQDGQGVNNRRAYKNIPFYLSSEHYGVFVHTSSFCKLSFADHSTRSVQLLTDDDYLDLFLIGGDTPQSVILGYHQLTGFPQLPPVWSYGIWMSRMTYFSAEEVDEISNRLRSEDFPCDVIHLDTGWFETDWLCEWKFNSQRFPDPEGFIRRLNANGFRVSLWQLPYISYKAAQYAEATENNYIGKSERRISGGSDFSVQDYAGTIDFTYDKATVWYQELLRNLLLMGVSCIKTDFGEDIHMHADYHSMSAERLHNLYPLLYQKAAYEVTRQQTGEGIIWARAGWAGCQRYPLHWGGDAACSWEGMAGSLKGGLQLGLSGFAFWSHDVPGFHGVPNFMNSTIPADLYVRWTQFGVFSSHIRYHGTSKREPWHFPEISSIIRKWWKLRYHLIPYIEQQSRKAVNSGLPLLRALYFHHPADRTCRHIDDQYYFGDDFLVAPVMNSESVRDVYLPEGLWISFFTGEEFSGKQWLPAVAVPLDEMPVYVKKGARIPWYPGEVSCTDEMDFQTLSYKQF